MTEEDLRKAAKHLAEMHDAPLPPRAHSHYATCRAVGAKLLELLPPTDAGPPFDAWSFIRDVLSRGASIEQDSRAIGRTYEQFSARLDVVARELADRLKPHLKPTGPQS